MYGKNLKLEIKGMKYSPIINGFSLRLKSCIYLPQCQA